MCTCAHVCGGGEEGRKVCGVCVCGGEKLHVCPYMSTELWKPEDGLRDPALSPSLFL